MTSLDVLPWPAERVPAGVIARPTRLGEIEVQRVQQMEARPAAYTAELVAERATRRPDTLDRPIGEPGAASLDWLTRPRPAGSDRSE